MEKPQTKNGLGLLWGLTWECQHVQVSVKEGDAEVKLPGQFPMLQKMLSQRISSIGSPATAPQDHCHNMDSTKSCHSREDERAKEG